MIAELWPLQATANTPPNAVLAIGVVIIGAGYLVRFHQMTDLIAGISPQTAAMSEERLAKLVGTNSMVIGLVVVGYGVALMQGLASGLLETVVVGVIVVLLAGQWLRAYGHI